MYVRLPSQLQSGLVTSALAAGTCLHIGLDDISSMCLVAQSCLTLCDPMDCSPPGSSVHEESPGKNTGVGCHALLQGNLPNPGIEPRSPTLAGGFFTTEPPGKLTLFDNLMIKFLFLIVSFCLVHLDIFLYFSIYESLYLIQNMLVS